ncbi:hypothetical protein [Dyella acidiphila]|uniref:Uncharacterized protein n=1 Tax=Dyella acidiphila TaxID=2775866 RepID=A0ABR9G6K3_9GAMM|nr:hypothetical protein [Dyella acidiphila]MBE1159643.1 hypothetical protein [Dyella acidiphila]
MPEIKGSYRGLIYIAIYRREGATLAWSASIEDDEGAVTFITGHFACREEAATCELSLRQKIYERMDAYVGPGDARLFH